ncbi:hypothetical protein COOONC_13828 [Cooperia oncophora]
MDCMRSTWSEGDIAQYLVTQVESIGDGYLCVSGLPARNGHRHVKDIAEMSLSFMDYVENFQVIPLPKEKIQLRIGVNSGELSRSPPENGAASTAFGLTTLSVEKSRQSSATMFN